MRFFVRKFYEDYLRKTTFFSIFITLKYWEEIKIASKDFQRSNLAKTRNIN